MTFSNQDLHREVQARVQRKRQSGDYPVGLEEQLEAEFRAILEVTHRGTHDLSHLHKSLSDLQSMVHQIRTTGDSSSRLPGGSLVHRLFRRLLRRHSTALTQDIQRVFRQVDGVLNELYKALEAQSRHDERLLNDVLGGVLDRLAVIDSLALTLPEIERKLLSQSPDAN